MRQRGSSKLYLQALTVIRTAALPFASPRKTISQEVKKHAGGTAMECLTVLETARKWDLPPRMVQHHCTAGHIPGAQKLGKSWPIPADAEKPRGA